MKKIFFWLLFPVFLIKPALAQEILTELQENPVLKNYCRLHGQQGMKSTLGSDALTLPLIEDFSSARVFPSGETWEDRNVFINNDFPVFPVTYGVATFDALDDTGAIYSYASFAPFMADYLTSRPVRLDSVLWPVKRAIKVSDSVYFSFYYQPQGNGNAPESNDSLVLEFLEFPGDTVITGSDTIITPAIWNHVWASEGMRLDTFQARYHVNFRQVMIPVTDSTRYFRKDFKFRFYNYASLADNNIPSWRSNVDEWNLDYVVLGLNRSRGDTTYEDVAFVNSPRSALKNYSEMPYSQYKAKPAGGMRSNFSNLITNLGRDTLIIHYGYKVYNAQGDTVRTYDGGDYNLKPYFIEGYQGFAPHAQPQVNFEYPSYSDDQTHFDIMHYIEKRFAAGDTIQSNDTLRYRQEFSNFYAYDDGTPEAGYGLTPAGAMLAYRFTLNRPDTLMAVNMFFNHVMNEANQKYFHLTVWNDNGGVPGDILYSSEVVKPYYADSLNRFHTYIIERETPVLLDTAFYVGWIQTTSDNLNVGFDRNNDAKTNIFYDISGSWTNTGYTGSLMIRPVLGHPTGASISENDNPFRGTLTIFPNPATGGTVAVTLPASFSGSAFAGQTWMEVYNASGKRVYSGPYMHSFPVAGLTRGLYLVKVQSGSAGASLTGKFILTY